MAKYLKNHIMNLDSRQTNKIGTDQGAQYPPITREIGENRKKKQLVAEVATTDILEEIKPLTTI